MDKLKVIAAMSGGVDSSVAAYLLKNQGYEVIGMTMNLCKNCDNDSHSSPEIEKARSVCELLGISFASVDFRDKFSHLIMEDFIRQYERGNTPNPCIRCNRLVKFGLLPEAGKDLINKIAENTKGENGKYSEEEERSPFIATGHYAVVEKLQNGRYAIKKATDSNKDQSYFLYTLGQDILSRTLMPLGNLTKPEVRKIAEEQGFINAKTKDSQDVCFIPDGDYSNFIKSYTKKNYESGNFVDTEGNILGKHKGIINYTIGQRKGLGLALKKPMYVYKIDSEKNEVVLSDNSSLFTTELIATDFNWVAISEEEAIKRSEENYAEEGGNTAGWRALGRIRYRHTEAPCSVKVIESCGSGCKVRVVFDEPQRAITPGQSVVLYDIETDTTVLGGGIIL